MSSFINKIKEKTSGSKGNKDEQQFSIQPHPAVRPKIIIQPIEIEFLVLQKSNNPAEVEGPQVGGGLNSNPEMQAHHARGPHVPSQEIKNSLEQPLVSARTFHAIIQFY
jgi:hypothetical protein